MDTPFLLCREEFRLQCCKLIFRQGAGLAQSVEFGEFIGFTGSSRSCAVPIELLVLGGGARRPKKKPTKSST
jgi:hypothetical protein